MFDILNIWNYYPYDQYMEHPSATPFYRAVDAASLGRSIADARKEAGLTQQQLAETLGVTRGSIVRLEHGQPVSTVVAMKAIRAIGRDVALVPRFAKLQVKQ
ncbi:helix-turn-helix transcriptional regulator [Arthrobacter sp. ISL-48]|uniref:helix-turn-helix transcriptional regulator n=1 Tax=Arthrobacter sp. ISL-48 TaxID=2819110 RepID=UPI001BE8486F|nr:helix-turn-helix transcriptional regulator [Arthrobacter sp. ISL-48]MBT2531401.1 helix-turn-helix transcriptional regulator [Arthrobacter sp. ISL-48]